VQSTGAILIAGAPSTALFTVVRLTPTGDLDTTYRASGFATAGFFGAGDSAIGMSLMSDDSVLVGGVVRVPDDAGNTNT